MRKILTIAFIIFSLSAFGQDKYEISDEDYQNESVEMADTLRSDGKIYVVVGIVTIILVVLLGYIIRTEKQLKRLENQLDKTDQNHKDDNSS